MALDNVIGKAYGSGYAEFTDGSTKQILELGKKVHYFNPSATPLFTLLGRMGKRSTPVPKFEWMEDEHFIKRSIKVSVAAGDAMPASGTIVVNRQAQAELIEVGNIYKASVSGTNAQVNGGTATVYHICTGQDSADSRKFNFKSVSISDSGAGNKATMAAAAAVWSYSSGTAGATLSLEFLGTADSEWASNAATNDTIDIHGAAHGYAEGADLQGMSSKKVRRLANYTQIFREPYQITRTAKVSKQYGEQEYARLQARKLAQLKGNIEWALLTNGNAVDDASSEAPRRRFAGFGIGGATGVGVIKSCDGRGDADFQWDSNNSTPKTVIDGLDAMIANMFQDSISGSMSKAVFCSNKWLKQLVAAVRESAGAQFESGMGKDIKAGLRVSSYMGPVGQLDFVQHPFLEGVHEDYALAVDFGNAEMRALAQSDVQLRKDVVKNGQDGETDEWLYEGGPEIRNEQTHAILKLV